MSKIYDTISSSIDTAYRLPHVAGDVVQKTDLRDAAQIITDGVEAFLDSYPTTPVITANTLTVELDRDRSYGSLELTNPLTIDVNTVTALDQKSATIALIPRGNSVAFSANLTNANSNEVIDITKQNDLVIGRVGDAYMYRVVRKISDFNPQIPAPVVTAFSLTETSLRFQWADSQYNVDTEIRISTDGITYDTPISLGVDTIIYDIPGLSLSDIRYVQVRYIGDGLLYDTSEWSSAVSAIVTVPYRSIIIDNNQSNYLVATPDSSINFGDGETDDTECSYSFWVRFNSLKSVNPVVSRSGTRYGMAAYGANANFVFALYDESTAALIYITLSNAITVGVWDHYTCTYTGSSTNAGLNIYKNGVLQAVARQTIGTYVAMPIENSFYIGKFVQNTNNHIADANISDVGVFTKVLNANESLELKDLGTNAVTTLSIYQNTALYVRLDGDISSEQGSVTMQMQGTLAFSTDGAY